MEGDIIKCKHGCKHSMDCEKCAPLETGLLILKWIAIILLILGFSMLLDGRI